MREISMLKSTYRNWVLAGVFLLSFCFVIGPVSAAGTVIEQGATVYIGDSVLDVTHALNSAQGSPIDGIPPYTTIGWWPSAAIVDYTSPTKSIDLGARYKNLFVSPVDFAGFEGAWYVVSDYTGQAAGSPAFYVRSPVVLSATVRVVPNTLNLASKGKFVAFITLPDSYKAADVDAKSIVCEGAPALKLFRIKATSPTFAAVFSREKLVNVNPGDQVKMTVTGTIDNNGQNVGFIGADTIRVISKGTKTKEPIDDVESMNADKVFTLFNHG
jgi:hypothetical protein